MTSPPVQDINSHAHEGTKAPDLAPHNIAEHLGKLGLSRFSGVYLWALFILIFALWVPDTFLTATTARAIGAGQAVVAVVALAALFTLVVGEYDLSVAQNMGFCALVAGELMTTSHLSPVAAVAITLFAGAFVGLLNGVLVAYVGVSSFIATLGMTSVLLAAEEAIAHGEYVQQVPTSFQGLTSHSILGIPSVIFYAIGLAAIAWYALEHTPVGRRMYAAGANAEAARLAGVRTRRYKFGAFIVCGLGASIAGILLLAQLGSVDQTVGPPYLLPAFAACFLGSTQFKPGRFNVWGTILALYLLATGVQGLQLAGGQLWITDLFNGVALIGAVSIAVISERRQVSRQTKQTAEEIAASEALAQKTPVAPEVRLTRG